MPIYEYRCKSCGHTLEALQKLSDAPLSKCPECGGPLEKLISRTAFQLKGGGWYSEGYGGSKSSPAAKDSTTASGTGDSKDKKPDGKKAASGGCGSGACGCH